MTRNLMVPGALVLAVVGCQASQSDTSPDETPLASNEQNLTALTSDDVELTYTEGEAHMTVRFLLSRFKSEIEAPPSVYAVWHWGDGRETVVDSLSAEGEGIFAAVVPTAGLGSHELQVIDLTLDDTKLVSEPVAVRMTVLNAEDVPEDFVDFVTPPVSTEGTFGVKRQGLSECGGCTNPNNIRGGGGNDILGGTDCMDNIDGRGGNDTIRGNGDRDTIHGSSGNDTIYGGDCTDYLYGDRGDDTIYGESAIDYIRGNDGRDNLYGGSSSDRIWGGGGRDLLHGGSGSDDRCYGNAGTDTFTACETAIQ